MVKLASALSRLQATKVLVVGDILLDMYTFGKARRISPEAPVAIVQVLEEKYLPGGAGNVALNLVSLGAEVVVLGRIGNDWAGNSLISSFSQENIGVNSLFIQENYRTPVKNRIIADNQQIVRVDDEQIIPLSELVEEKIIESFPELFHGINIVAISDYGKGFLTTTLLNALISYAKKMKIPVITDPKGSDFSKYFGTTIIKPNLSEAYAAANMPVGSDLEKVAAKILELSGSDLLMVTRSEAGISLFSSTGSRYDFPVHVKQVKDVTGAGDTVLAMFTHALANELSYQEAAQLCNVAAGIAIEQIGCARVTLSEIAHRLLERDVKNKVFDEEHIFALQQVLNDSPFNVLVLSNSQTMSFSIFDAIKTLASNGENLLLFIKDEEPNEKLIEILSSLVEVNFILVHENNLRTLLRKVTPKECYQLHSDELTKIDFSMRQTVFI